MQGEPRLLEFCLFDVVHEAIIRKNFRSTKLYFAFVQKKEGSRFRPPSPNKRRGNKPTTKQSLNILIFSGTEIIIHDLPHEGTFSKPEDVKEDLLVLDSRLRPNDHDNADNHSR